MAASNGRNFQVTALGVRGSHSGWGGHKLDDCADLKGQTVECWEHYIHSLFSCICGSFCHVHGKLRACEQMKHMHHHAY